MLKPNSDPQISSTQALVDLLANIAAQGTQPKEAALALRRLYELSSSKLFHFVSRIVHKPEWAEDILQDTFIKVWAQAASYDAAKAAPMTWLYTIARNTAFDVLRRNEHEKITQDINDPLFDESRIADLSQATTQANNPMHALSISQDTALLTQCFARLDGNTRQAIGMAFYHDMSHSDIAESLNKPLGTVKAWVRRGLMALNTCLGQLGYVPESNTKNVGASV